MDECLYHKCKLWSQRILTQSKPFESPLWPRSGRRLSRIQLLTSKISHICQEICDIKSTRKPKSNSLSKGYTSTGIDEGRKDRKSTREPNSSSFATEDNDDGDGLDETYSSHSKQCHCEPSNLDIPSHHVLSPPSPSPGPSGSTPTPPANLSPSPTSRIGTVTPSSPS